MRDPTPFKSLGGVPPFLRVFRFLKQQRRFVVKYLSISASLHGRNARDVPFAAAVCSPCFVNDRHPQPIASALVSILKVALGNYDLGVAAAPRSYQLRAHSKYQSRTS